MTPPIRVLVVDDSAFIRKVLGQILKRTAGIEVVGTAGTGTEALGLVERLSPDVITLDLNMPDIDGLEFLRRQMAARPVPVVICTVTNERSPVGVTAMELGAAEFVQKPTALATDLIYDLAGELVAKVRAAAAVDMARLLKPVGLGAAKVVAPKLAKHVELIVIGVSTGGPQALRSMVPRLPADFPVPLVAVLHIPIGYTTMYAARLNEISLMDVVEARHGDVLSAGRLYLAPAGQHMRAGRDLRGRLVSMLSLEPASAAHRPSVDVLFQSAGEASGNRVIGVVLTGMGSDGLEGSRTIKAHGGTVITESEASCVVYGMPRAVHEAGLSDHVTSLGDLPSLLAELV